MLKRSRTLTFVLAIFLIAVASVASAEGVMDTKVLINYQDKPFAEVMTDLATQAKTLVKFDPAISGSITLNLGETTLSKALNQIAVITETYWGLTPDGVIAVSPPNPKGPYFKDISEVKIIKINHITVDEVIKALADHPYLGFTKPVQTTNTLCVIAPPAIIARLEADVRRVDVPKKMIKTKVAVLDTSRVKNKEFNIDLEYTTGLESTEPTVRTIQLADMVLGYTSIGAKKTLMSLKNSYSQDELKIMAQPELVARDNEEANLSNVKRYTVPSAIYWGVTAPPAQFKEIEAGIKLKVRPRAIVGEDGEDWILITIEPSISEVVGTGPYGVPVVNLREISSTLLVRNGETIIAATSISDLGYDIRTITKVPILSEIPLIGKLFTFPSKRREVRNQTITILITPTILVAGEKEPEVEKAKGIIEERKPEPVMPKKDGEEKKETQKP